MKKVLVISSSPRKNGNSDILAENFANGAINKGCQVEKINLREKNINYCAGCGYCNTIDYSGCSQKDDMEEILNKIIEADVILMATPVYFYTMCGQMKTLIDRCCAKYTKIQNKDFYFILTAADNNKNALNRTMEEFRGFLACLNSANEKETLYATGVWQKNDVNTTNYPDITYKMGQNV